MVASTSEVVDKLLDKGADIEASNNVRKWCMVLMWAILLVMNEYDDYKSITKC